MPVSGIGLGDQVYVVVRRIHPIDRTKDRSFLTKFIAPGTFQQLRTVSALPEGRFIKMSMHAQPGPIAGLPSGGPFVLMWGTGAYRQSDAYLSIVPVTSFESGSGTRYFAGLDAEQALPCGAEKESDSVPVAKDGTLGDLSVTWCKDLGLWLMTYDHTNATGWHRVFLLAHALGTMEHAPGRFQSRARWRSRQVHSQGQHGGQGMALPGPSWGRSSKANPGSHARRRLCSLCRRALDKGERLPSGPLLRYVDLESICRRPHEIALRY